MCKLRLCCSELEGKTHFRLGQVCFSVQAFTHSKHAFDRLTEISQSRFASDVRELHLGPTCPDHGVAVVYPGINSNQWLKPEEQFTKKFQAWAIENRVMKATAQDLNVLVSAFSRMRNLDRIKFISENDRRYRPLSYGEMYHFTLKVGRTSETVIIPTGGISCWKDWSRLFYIVLLAAETAKLKIREIDGRFGEYMKYPTHDDGPVPLWDFPSPSPDTGSLSAFSNLQVLRLCLGLNDDIKHDDHLVVRLTSFLSAAPDLRWLELNFHCALSYVMSFLLSLTSRETPTLLPSLTDLLVLTNPHVCTDGRGKTDLLKILSRFRHIRALRWSGIRFYENEWKEVLEYIRDHMSNLRSLSLTLLLLKKEYILECKGKVNEDVKSCINTHLRDLADDKLTPIHHFFQVPAV